MANPVEILKERIGLNGGTDPGDSLVQWEFSLDRGESWWPLEASPATRERLIAEGALIRPAG